MVSEGSEEGLLGGPRLPKLEVSISTLDGFLALTIGAWRPSRTASGNFEGVLGFGGPAPAPAPAPAPVSAPAPPLAAAAVEPSEAPQSPWKEKGEQKEKVGEVFGSGGGPGWGTGQKKWRIAAGLLPATENEKVSLGRLWNVQDRTHVKPHTISIPISTHESISESVAASASATPLPERDATVEETASRLATPVPASQSLDSAPPAQEKEDLGAIEWFYRDPGGQEQGEKHNTSSASELTCRSIHR